MISVHEVKRVLEEGLREKFLRLLEWYRSSPW